MAAAFLFVFVTGGLAELYVLIAAGGAFGAGPVVLACLATALIGGAILRFQGFAAVRQAQADVEAGNPPVAAAVDGVFLLIAAPFLLTPGFLTDIAGFLLLIPPLRRAIARAALKRLRRSIDEGRTTVIVRRP
ncbi:MAG: FxsA family protein [Pseudomonadota bacterium]